MGSAVLQHDNQLERDSNKLLLLLALLLNLFILTYSLISSLLFVVWRRWVVIWKALIELYRFILQSSPNTDLLSIDSIKSTPRIPMSSPQSTFQIIRISTKGNNDTIQPLHSSFQALSIRINTARPRSPLALAKHTLKRSAPSMTIVTSNISKSDHFKIVCSMTVGTTAS